MATNNDRLTALEEQVKSLKETIQLLLKQNQQPFERLSQLRNERKLLQAKPYKYADDVSKLLSIDTEVGDILRQIENG